MFEPVVSAVPDAMRGKLEPAELYHEVLEHRWFLSERAGQEVDAYDAAQLHPRGAAPAARRGGGPVGDGVDGPLANPFDPSMGSPTAPYDKPYDPWEDDDEAPVAKRRRRPAYLDIAALRAKAKQ